MQLNKKLLSLLIGTSLACVPFMSNAAFHVGQTILGPDGFLYTIYASQSVVPDQEITPPLPFEDPQEDGVEEALETFISANGGVVDASGNLTTFDVDRTPAPFDAGLSVLLGAGAIAGIKRARNRKQAATV